MRPPSPDALLPRTILLDWRAPAALAVACATVLALTLGLSVARSTPVGSDAAGQRVAALTRGDLTEASLKRLTAAMDPAAAALARRYDRALFTPDIPSFALGAQSAAELLPFPQIEGPEAQRINGAIPFASGELTPAAPFVLQARTAAERERAVRCLTNAIYYEAALEPVEGQKAVAQVVLNRVRDPNFPKSVCGVVYQGWERLTGCQFSFTCDGALVRAPVPALWREDRKVAEAALNGAVMPLVGAATHYHADYVAPYWAPTLVKIAQVGAHIFYRWPGDAGQPAALNAAYAGGELRLSEAVLTGRAPRAEPAPERPGLGAKTVQVAGPDGQTHARVSASFEPAQYGRRAATPEEIARINALLEQRFPTGPATAQAQPAAAPESSPTAG